MTATQTELDVALPPRLFSCTPSRLTTWLDCPRRYRFSYVDRPTPPRAGGWAHNSVGAAVHVALAAWWSLPVEDRSPQSAGGLVRARCRHGRALCGRARPR
jgi:putative RecB family exonuclease